MKIIKSFRNKALVEVDPNYIMKDYIDKNGRVYHPLLISKSQYDRVNLTDTWNYEPMVYGKDYIVVKKENLNELGL